MSINIIYVYLYNKPYLLITKHCISFLRGGFVLLFDFFIVFFMCIFLFCRLVRIAVYAVLIVAVVIFFIVDTSDDRQRLMSILGVFCLLLFGFIFSAAPRAVRWRHVIWGMSLQLIMGLLILRWTVGQAVFACAGSKVSAFLAFSDEGAKFIFRYLAVPDQIFAFTVSVVRCQQYNHLLFSI